MGFAIACDDIFLPLRLLGKKTFQLMKNSFQTFYLSVCLERHTCWSGMFNQFYNFFFLRIRVLFSRESNKKWVKNNFLVHITCFISFLYFAAFCKNKKTHLTNERVMKNKQEIFYFAVLLEMWNSLKLSIVRLLI
jgi:hypothetical protein